METTDGKLRVLSIREIRNKEFPKQTFLIGPNLLPRNGAMILAAQTGVGKSWVALHIAKCLAAGNPLFGAFYHKTSLLGQPRFPVTQVKKVLYLDYELTHGSRQLRFQSLEEFPDDYADRVVFPETAIEFNLHRQLGQLKALVNLHRPDVLIVDPLSSTHPYDENTFDIKKAFNALDQIRALGVTIIVIHHASSKALRNRDGEIKAKLGKEMFRGHSSIVDWADLAVTIDEQNMSQNEGENEDKIDEKNLLISFAKVRHGDNVKPVRVTLDFKSGRIFTK